VKSAQAEASESETTPPPAPQAAEAASAEPPASEAGETRPNTESDASPEQKNP
jgi:hypothetical protein